MKYDFPAKIYFIYAVKVKCHIIYRPEWDAFRVKKDTINYYIGTPGAHEDGISQQMDGHPCEKFKDEIHALLNNHQRPS